MAIPTDRPELSIEVGANTRKALYVSGADSATLRFEYEIVAGDEDNDGIAIPADALSTPTREFHRHRRRQPDGTVRPRRGRGGSGAHG